jgi:diguanylate cyclase (GGDEF)-like protein/PAS domain S-box-containing protein
MPIKSRQQEQAYFSHSFRFWLISLGAVATLLITVILWYGSELVARSVALEQQWGVNYSIAAELGDSLSNIRAAFGYGGFIHNFKNLILRKDESRIALAEADLTHTYSAIERYLSQNISAHEREDVARVRATVDQYRDALERTKQLIRENRDISSQEMDRMVRIDDEPAKRALAELARYNFEKSVTNTAETSRSLDETLRAIYLGMLFIPLVLMVFLMIVLFLRRLLRVNQELDDTRHYVSNLFEAAPDATLVIDANGAIVRVNQKAEELLGYRASELVTLSTEDLMPGRYREVHSKYREESYRGRKGREPDYGQDFIALTRGGDEIPVDITIGFIEQQGSEYSIVTLRDISKKKQVDKELSYNREMLNIAQEIASVGSWDWDLVNDELHWSDEMYSIFGLDPKGNKTDYELFLRFIHLDDREPIATAINEAVIMDKPFENEFRIFRLDGEERILEGSGEVIRDESGKATRMVGIIHDITEFKKAQYELALSDNVFKHAAEAIIITDSQNCVLRVNSAFSRLTQYSKEEALNKTPQEMLKSFQHDSHYYDEIWASLNSEGKWSGELWDRRKDGEVFPTYQNISVVKDRHGHVVQHISVISDITEKKKAEESIKYLAHFDQLTGLHNRVLFKDRLEHAVVRARRNNVTVALLFIDLDRFKYVNDTLGHDAGDQLLIEVANILRECVRAHDTVARLGGDEFTVILEDLPHGRDAAIVASKIIDELVKPFTIHNQEAFIGSSIGIAIFPDNAETPEEVIKNADIAMYFAKESGRNQYQFYTQELADRSSNKFFMESRLRRALENNEFEVYYQPQVSIDDSRIIGAEALVRWNDPEHGIISPTAFIPAAEESGLIEPLGLWVMEHACRQAAKWCRDIDPNFCISVNLSSRQLAGGGVFDSVQSILESSGLSAENLELEITESAIMENPERGIQQLEQIRGLGVAIAIDDFGTGYSSLSYLKRLPITRVKIDRSFIKDAHVNRDDEMIVNAIIVMSQSLGLRVIAEGVEHELHLKYLRSSGCNEYQGFYFSKPVPAKQFELLLQLDD